MFLTGLRYNQKATQSYISNNSSSQDIYVDSESEYIPSKDNLSLKDVDDNNTSMSSGVEEYIEESKDIENPSTIEGKYILNRSNLSILPKDSKPYNFNGSVETSKKKSIMNKRVWDKTDHCVYCEKDVTNFTRHILRKHKDEIEVAKYESLPKGSKERKFQADILRKKGNFLSNVGGNKVKPVRRPNELKGIPCANNYLPCKFCYGMFKKKYLFRHMNICKNNKEKHGSKVKAMVAGQNMLLVFKDTDNDLVNNVFSRMATDEIALVAKTDELIKQFGSRYLKSHKEKHLINVVSQKMRLLARFLMCMRLEVTTINTLQECLSPKYFDSIIKCSKQVAGYSVENDSFKSPSVILKLGQSLKQCCEIAECIILKQSDLSPLDAHNVQKESINNLKYIIEKEWAHELSTNACKLMYQRKWNKPALLPLTSDIKLFKDYIVKLEKESYNNLKINPNNVQFYRNLQESVLAQLVLLNRRRAGEVQRITLDTYTNAQSEISQEEIQLALSPVELKLTESFKRVVIRGKRGRGVPILFTPQLQKSLNYLIKLRNTVSFIENENIYLFPLPQSLGCLRASDVIRKYSKLCGAKNPENITSTRLRKHVATVAQLLNMSEGDIEQLATFMGHSKDVHKNFYRLSESAFQVNNFEYLS